VRRIVLVTLSVVGVLLSGCEDPDTTSYDPMGAAADAAELDLVPHDQIASCVDWTRFGVLVGDAAALARWDSAGESDAGVAEACLEIWRADPTELAAIDSEWSETETLIAASP
jgi:hypothetical protein